MSLLKSFALVSLAFSLAACGGAETQQKPAEEVKPAEPAAQTAPAEPAATQTAPAAAANPGPKGSAVVNPDDNSQAQDLSVETKGDELAFNVAELSAKAGSPIRIKFANKATAAGMMHGVVVTKAADVEGVANAGLMAGQDNGYVPNDDARVLGASKLFNPGEGGTVLLKGLDAGDYVIFCSFPGHYMTMQIKLHVG